MLTRQGWLVGVGALVLLVGGRILGLLEVFALGVVATTLLVASAALVRTARLQLEVGRVVHPARVHVGQRSRVDLAVRNRRGRRTPVLRLRDPVSGTRGADLLVPPLGPSERSVAAYRLPTDRRGIVDVGPLEVVVSDPFGLVDLATVAAPAVHLTVLPHIDVVSPLPYTSAHDPQAGVRQANSLGRTGEEFYALRPFTVGDDLRRVHWPSSARLDELMVRQNELPWQGRTTVLLDVREASHRGDSLEVAVSAAASVVAATARRQDLVRLVTTSGSDSDYAPGTDHVHAILEHLAVVGLDAEANLHRTLDLLSRRSSGARSSSCWRRCLRKTSGRCTSCGPASGRSRWCRSTARRGTAGPRSDARSTASSTSPPPRRSRRPGRSTSAACPTAAPASGRGDERTAMSGQR